MIFDEPTSSLPRHDVERLFAIIRRLQQRGMAVIYISHFLEEIRQVAQRYVVPLRDGQSVATGRIEDATDQHIVSLMAGRSVDTLFPTVPHAVQEVALDVKQLSGVTLPREVTLQVRRGEIFGLFGLVGAGRTETLRCIFGLDRSSEGTVTLRKHSHGKHSLGKRPRDRIQAGMGLVS